MPFTVAFDAEMPRSGYAYLIFSKTAGVALHTSESRVTGLLRLIFKHREQAESVGGENFDVFVPPRRPGGQNLAIRLSKPLELFGSENITNGWQRPTSQPNAWVADREARDPELRLEWNQSRTISEATLYFDGDFDHAMETVLWGHPERVVPFCVKRYELVDDKGDIVAAANENHHSLVRHRFEEPIVTAALTLRVCETWGAPAAVFEIRVT